MPRPKPKPASAVRRGGVLLGLLCLGAAASAAAGTARRLELGGLAVYVQQRDAEQVRFRAYLRAGQALGPPGLADLAAAWLELGGTLSLPGKDFVAALEALEASVQARADRDLLTVELTLPRAGLRPGARLFADLLMYPAFDPSVEARARLLAAETPARDPAVERLLDDLEIGSAEALAPAERLTRERVLAFHRDRVGRDSTVVMVEGSFDAPELEAELRAAFLGFARARAPFAPSPTHPASGRWATLALHEEAPGRSRLVVARVAEPRASPLWSESLERALSVTLVDLKLALSERGAKGRIAVASRVEQPLQGPDLVLVEVHLPSRAVPEAVAVFEAERQRERTRMRSRDERAQAARWLAALRPPQDAPHAAAALALFEALGGSAPQALD